MTEHRDQSRARTREQETTPAALTQHWPAASRTSSAGLNSNRIHGPIGRELGVSAPSFARWPRPPQQVPVSHVTARHAAAGQMNERTEPATASQVQSLNTQRFGL